MKIVKIRNNSLIFNDQTYEYDLKEDLLKNVDRIMRLHDPVWCPQCGDFSDSVDFQKYDTDDCLCLSCCYQNSPESYEPDDELLDNY